jgi:hypothetical protein
MRFMVAENEVNGAEDEVLAGFVENAGPVRRTRISQILRKEGNMAKLFNLSSSSSGEDSDRDREEKREEKELPLPVPREEVDAYQEW